MYNPKTIPNDARRILLPIGENEKGVKGVTKTMLVVPMFPFAPLGLMLWGVDDDSTVEQIKLGNYTEGIADCQYGIPARYFEAGHSFEKLMKLSECGELESVIPERAFIDMSVCEPGCNIVLRISGRFERACFWGLTCNQWESGREITMWRDGDEFRGEISWQSLTGKRTLLTVNAPTESACVAMINEYQRRR